MEFKCLFCQHDIKDGELMCKSSCEHLIHEYCIDVMKSYNEHHCKFCKKIIIVYSHFLEFDLCRAVTINSMITIVEKLDEIVKLMSKRDQKLTELTKNYQDIADKINNQKRI
ncbi:hypothetical protein PVAND_002041 [Polypedilum vanderplanki]|uniref:RING-type domain-containing protein n=1 Tax=Polypedilum vanderplanki TaxID=319348 RepID=A0A9J6BR67_POLVA|nr:hypothetical protein PVAND_002041 [Polypedilum vanderplanki]